MRKYLSDRFEGEKYLQKEKWLRIIGVVTFGPVQKGIRNR